MLSRTGDNLFVLITYTLLLLFLLLIIQIIIIIVIILAGPDFLLISCLQMETSDSNDFKFKFYLDGKITNKIRS